MDVWKSQALKIINVVLGNPSGQTELWTMAGVGILALLVVMRYAAAAAGISDIGWMRRILAILLGVGAMLAAEIAANLYAVPRVHGALAANVVRIAAPILGAAAVGVPLQVLVLHARYGQALVAFAASVMAAVLLMMGAKAMMGSVETGGEETERLLDRQEETRDMLRKIDK